MEYIPNKERISNYIECFTDCLGIDKSTKEGNTIKNLFIESIYLRANKYKNIKINIKDDGYQGYIIKPKNGQYTPEDFLLNRLFISISKIANNRLNENEKAKYDSIDRDLQFDFQSIDNLLKRYISDVNLRKKSIHKTFTHEIGHALQVRRNGGYVNAEGTNKNSSNEFYERLIQSLSTYKNGMLKNEIKDYSEICKDPSNVIAYGIRGNKYSKSSYIFNDIHLYKTTYIDEIMNELEALELYNYDNEYQKYNHIYNKNKQEISGYYVNNRNHTSLYNKGIGISKALKILLGPQILFELQYLNSDEAMKKTDKEYENIVKQMYPNQTSLFYLLGYYVIEIFKEKRTYEPYLKLEELLSRCIEQKVNKTLSNPNLNGTVCQKMLISLTGLLDTCTHHENSNIDNNLFHVKKYKELIQKIKLVQENMEQQNLSGKITNISSYQESHNNIPKR